MKLDIEAEFKNFMATAYKGGVDPNSLQWAESRRVFVAGIHLAACRVMDSPTPKADAQTLVVATSAFARSTLASS